MCECRNESTPAAQPSRRPAHELWVELSTRITSQDLHFRSGQEEAAVKSVVDVFETTRALMRANPEAAAFLTLAGCLLETIRPYTNRWHAWQDERDLFLGPTQRLQFRLELQQLQPQLKRFAELLKQLAEGGTCDPLPAKPEPSRPTLGADVPMGIDLRYAPAATPAADGAPVPACDAFKLMNEVEAQHVAARSGVPVGPATVLLNRSGLALSGGGIRSATFGLGVVQGLAQAKLLTQFDYLSTVSGGGYLGCFLSNQFTAADVAAPTRPETDPAAAVAAAAGAFSTVFTHTPEDSKPIRHLRNCSKYLLPTTTLERLKLVGLLISGVLATTLLAAAIPVACAFVVHWIARLGWLDGEHVVRVPGTSWALPPFWFLAASSAVAAILCWLLRPITRIWRYIRDPIDNFAACASVLAGMSVAVAATPSALKALAEALGSWKVTSTSIVSLATLLSGAAVVKAIGEAWKYRKALARLFIFSGAFLFVIVYLVTVQQLGFSPIAERVVGILLLVWLLWSAAVNLNLTGLHRYYRDRLASCYLEDPGTPRGIPNPPPLEKLAAKLPYHLINTTVNLTSSRNPDLRGRGGDFFLLSKYVCGSVLTGYRRTPALSALNSDLDLATAMAISGAAASTNMGWQTLHQYRMLMAIFNVRLGYWMRWQTGRRAWLACNAFGQLTREMFGLLDERSSSINVSDGGHIENLGVYELIRRKLKFIVCVDGGMDGAMACADLNRLQRLVAIDFGYRLHFDAADLKLTNNFSNRYGILVKIDYTPEVERSSEKQLGWMLYIKLAMLGTESSYVLDYRRENPLFPHQTTADQFFDEAQFEAYRKLGETAARSFLWLRGTQPDSFGFREWFESLALYLLGDTDPVYGSAAPASAPAQASGVVHA
jgi:hypothetical protein